MKNILIIGIGGTGSNAAVVLDNKIKEFGKTSDVNVTTLVFDTDMGDIEELKTPYKIAMADNASVGEICDRIGKKYLREWFPCDDKSVRNQEMFRGASQWRKKSYLAFLNVMNQPMKRKTLNDALECMMKDPAGTCEVYVMCSLAGGTGSGSVIPLTLYVKRYLRKVVGVNPVVRGMFALPGIFAGKQTRENGIKVYANAYGVLREINAINLVARDYNNGHQLKKNTPVRYKLGNENEPNVGVLFDSQDPAYWTPQAAPFEQIFVLDKIMGIDEPKMHDIVLANSLYSIICTDIGKEIDSEASNHEILHSQSNGSNAIFSSISSSQIRFPKDSILSYLAYDKTEASCKDEWLIIHDEVEKEIKRIEKEKRENGNKKPFTTKDYAELYEKTYKKFEDKGRSPVVELVDRSIYYVDDNGNKTDIEEQFFKKLKQRVKNLIIANYDQTVKDLGSQLLGKKDNKKVVTRYNSYTSTITDAYEELVNTIKSNINLYSEQIFSLEYKKFPVGSILKNELNEEYSLIHDLISRDKKYIHPVAAMLQLCKLKKHIGSKKDIVPRLWTDLSREGREDYFNEELLNLTGAVSTSEPKGKGKVKQQYKAEESYYADLVPNDNGHRFENMANEFKEDKYYAYKKSNATADDYFIKKDAEALIKKLYDRAVDQMCNLIFVRLDECIEILIKNYRGFFARFEKERENLIELATNAKIKDSTNKGALINVYSTVESKEKIAKKVFNLAGPESDEEIAERDDIVGSSVFETIYKKSVAQTNEGLVPFNDKDAKPYTSLFDSMVTSYKNVIKKSDAFAEIDTYNVVQAILESEDDPAMKKAALETVFTNACSLATPQLRLDKSNDNEDVVQQSEITVFLMSFETGRFIKRHAEELEIKIDDEDVDEDALITACAKQFIAQYSKQRSVRLALVNNIPDYIIYCTGEVMDISPLRIPQFDELATGDDAKYFKNYEEALRLAKKFDTDMWNPHLGYDLDKQSNLPYLNTKKGEEKDKTLVKALISLLNEGKLWYGRQNGSSETGSAFIYSDVNGIEKKVYSKNADGVVSLVNKDNIAELMNWIRELDEEEVNHYANRLDERIRNEKQKLPTVISETDIVKLLSTIDTINVKNVNDDNKTFMRILCKELFTIDKESVGIIDFAFKIKNSEENSSDYDDAERILKVANEIFEEIVSYRTNPTETPQLYIRTATQAYSHIYKWIATKALNANQGVYENADSQYTRIVTWMNSAGCFRIRKEEAFLEGNMELYSDCKFDEAYNLVKPNDIDEKFRKNLKNVQETPEVIEEKPITEE